MTRIFEDATAVRERVPLLIGLTGPSGSGKTFSMLRLATGIQRETGGETFVIDTEARRALWYADQFKFKHLEFKAPFGPLDYLAAIEHCVRKGAKTICVDSQSHEHEGEGGVLAMHEAELDRLAGQDWQKRERVKFLAWAKPKAERRRLLNAMLQMSVNFILCFRAKEKLKLERGKEPIPLGWQAIAGDEFVYEMTLNLLLPPACGGVPELAPKEIGERAMLKIPAQFRDLVMARPLDEDLGQALAKWAAGGAAPRRSESAIAPEKQLLAQVKELLDRHCGTDTAKRAEATLLAFGSDDPRRVAKMPLAELETGVAALRRNLEGVAEMAEQPERMREPGEEED